MGAHLLAAPVLALFGWGGAFTQIEVRPADALLDRNLPYVRLFDTGAPSPDPLPEQPDATRWKLVPEGATQRFQGDAAIANDKLLVLLPKGCAGAAVYSKTEGRMRRRVTLVPTVSPGSGPGALSSIAVAENSPAAVELEAEFMAETGQGFAARLRLTAGECFLEARGGRSAGCLAVQGDMEHIIVPEFLADDMVFSRGTSHARPVGLPVENCLLGLLGGRDAMVMCLWRGGARNVEACFAEGRAGPEAACRVEWTAGERLWIALLEGPGIWHARQLQAEEQHKELALDWRPPFPAVWRCDLVRDDGMAESWAFVDAAERKAQEALAGFSSPAEVCVAPCWLDEGRAFVLTEGGRLTEACRTVVIYPNDRSGTTPLTAFCPTDAMRSLLGVGPCQYILEAEGLGTPDATPVEVTAWVEKQFERKRDVREAARIRERLDQMVLHIERSRARIAKYGDLARRIRALCQEAEATAGAAETARTLGPIAADLERSTCQRASEMGPPGHADQLAGMFAAYIGQGSPLAECQAIGRSFRRIGAAQDWALAACRMGVRRLKVACRAAAHGGPDAAALAGRVQREVAELADE